MCGRFGLFIDLSGPIFSGRGHRYSSRERIFLVYLCYNRRESIPCLSLASKCLTYRFSAKWPDPQICAPRP